MRTTPQGITDWAIEKLYFVPAVSSSVPFSGDRKPTVTLGGRSEAGV